METITLNNGKVLNGRILEDGFGEKIFVYLEGMDLMRGFRLMSDVSKTSVMVANNRGEEHTYTGYTEILAIDAEYGNCNLVMRRPVQQIQQEEPEVVSE